jgi:hypothetical protein
MIDPITGFGIILSLIPLYQRERDKREAASKEKFFEWLIGHNFTDLKTQIQSNYDLCTEIETLLQMNQEQLLARFDEVDQKLFCIMNSMQEFRSLVRMVAPRAGLTEQEESVLRQFVNSGDLYLLLIKTSSGTFCNTDNVVNIKFDDIRVIDGVLRRLVSLGFLVELSADTNVTRYKLTEQSIEYVNNLKKSDLSDQAKSILKQYVESKVQYLLILRGDGQAEVMAENTLIKVDNPRFIYDDINELEEREFIRFDEDINFGGKRYMLTREGDNYYQKDLK